MAARLSLILSSEERTTLEQLRNRAPKAYLRERAAALLKIADGQSARQVARSGLLRRRHPDTVEEWYHRYRDHGLGGLTIYPGRGRKPAFSPPPD